MLLIDVAFFIVLAHIIMSWLINFGVLNMRQPIVAQIWDGLNRLLEPVYGPIRRMLPAMGGLDLAPLVVSAGALRGRDHPAQQHGSVPLTSPPQGGLDSVVSGGLGM